MLANGELLASFAACPHQQLCSYRMVQTAADPSNYCQWIQCFNCNQMYGQYEHQLTGKAPWIVVKTLALAPF